ncbi:MAG: flavodoxin family protein [Verrucomicrobiales bacterium]|nr:flavodoxin family protein [Verrucomicrobiales bacterium]
MRTIAIVYFSGSGHTALMAEAVQRGAAATGGVAALLLPIDGRKIVEGRFADDALLARLNDADAIVFGSPTYMGGVAAQFKAFADATAGAWFARSWSGKPAAGFTHSGSPSGDKLSTLQYLSLFAAQHGMVWIGNADLPSVYRGQTDGFNRLNSFLGVMGYTSQSPDAPPSVDSGDLLTAEALGRRVADLVRRLPDKNPMKAVSEREPSPAV